MDLLVVVLVDLVILLGGEGSKRRLDNSVGVLGAHHEANLARGVGGDGGVGVLGNGENVLARLLEVLDDGEVQPDVLGLGGDDTLLGQSIVEQLKVGLLEERLGRALGVGGVGDDDIKGVLVLGQELEAIANVDLDTGVVKANSEAREVLLGDTGDGLVNVTEDSLLDALVLDDLAENTTVTAADDEDLLGVRVGVHGQVGDHLLVAFFQLAGFIEPGVYLRELVTLSDLDGAVENEHITVISGFKDQNLFHVSKMLGKD